MRPPVFRSLVLAAAGLAGILLMIAPDVPAAAAGSEARSEPVVVELFTSQGCSSCPPADRLLSRIDEVAGAGVEVIPLAFHVDYWNRLGWADPFSSPEWSERQSLYARALGSDRVYTPQLVVDGRRHEVGSNEGRVRDALAEAASRRAAGRVALEVRRDGDALVVDVTAENRRGEAPLELWLATVEDGLETSVRSGENARRTLRNDHVVRRFERLTTLEAAAGSRAERQVRIALAEDWRPAAVGVVALLQHPETLAIEGAAAARP